MPDVRVAVCPVRGQPGAGIYDLVWNGGLAGLWRQRIAHGGTADPVYPWLSDALSALSTLQLFHLYFYQVALEILFQIGLQHQ